MKLWISSFFIARVVMILRRASYPTRSRTHTHTHTHTHRAADELHLVQLPALPEGIREYT
jgi:hypothetical protein